MLENEPYDNQPDPSMTSSSASADASASESAPPRRRRVTKKAAAAADSPPGAAAAETAVGAPAFGAETSAPDPGAARAPRKRVAKKTAEAPPKEKPEASAREQQGGLAAKEQQGGLAAKDQQGGLADETARSAEPTGAAEQVPAKRAARRRAGGRSDAGAETAGAASDLAGAPGDAEPAHAIPSVLFKAPEPEAVLPRRGRRTPTAEPASEQTGDHADAEESGDAGRRRRRGGRGRRGHGEQTSAAEPTSGDADLAGGADLARAERGSGDEADETSHDSPDGESGSSAHRRRRRRRRGAAGEVDDHAPDDPPNTVVRVREPREHERGGAQGIKGSTRLEAKKQRRREGREQIRRGRRGSVLTEAEFLARRESVDRVMAVRQRGDRTQIGVLEDGILVEHFVSTAAANRMVGNVYLGRVQNVLPGMEAAFVDIGKGRNAVLYAGEVNFDMTGLEGQPRRIESALKSGQAVLVQVTKDPIGHKGARLTSQVSLPGRYLVYVPEGSMMGISRKLPDVERSRLKSILKKVMPEGAGVIVRTAAEGASEEELARDVARLGAQWDDIKRKAEGGNAPTLLYSEPDLTIRVIRDIFNEDFNALVVQAESEWDTVEAYVAHVAPDLMQRVSRWTSEEDIFAHYRVEEQLAKALDRKVWLPSGGYLVIDRTEAMIVIDVNTGRFIGKGGNLEETVTKNNLEAAEEIVRQLRLRDIGGIIVIDFIDMVLESNRELVLRRLVECLGRDRTKHQVAEVTSLGLVQMTRKRVGTGLLEAFSEVCEHCNGRGVIVHTDPVVHRPPRAITPKPAPPRGGRRPAESEAAVPEADASVAQAPASTLDAGPEVDSTSPDTEPVPVAASDGTAAGGSRTRRGGRRRGGSRAAAVVAEPAPSDSSV
jgi:ribonuclease E